MKKRYWIGGAVLAAVLGIGAALAGSSSNYTVLVARVASAVKGYTAGNPNELTQTTDGSLHVAGFGTAGSADTNVVTVQGIASGTNLPVAGSGTAGTAATGVVTVQGIAGGVTQFVSPTAPTDELHCYVTTTATTSTQITGCEVSTGKSIYITTACVGGDILSATATPFTIQSGTSTACTGPHVLWSGWHPALTSYCTTFPTPLKVTVSEGLCILDATTGSKAAAISGYVR